MLKAAAGTLALLVLAGTPSLEVHAEEAGDRAADRAAIEALMWRYVRALDTLDADAYASVFTENGRFGSGANAVTGRQALKAMIEGLRGDEPRAPMYHMITNYRIEFLGENRARYDSYWMTVFGAAEQGAAPRVAAAGRGVDELVRVDGQWLIESRNVAPED